MIAKLCSFRDTDKADVESEAVRNSLDWDLLEHLATDEDELKASIAAALAGEEQELTLPAVEVRIRGLQERQLEIFQLIVGAGPDCTDYDEELQQANMAKTSLMAKKAELERTQQTAPVFEHRLEELSKEVDGATGAISAFDELTVRQLISNIKVLDKENLLVRFKDGTEITQQK